MWVRENTTKVICCDIKVCIDRLIILNRIVYVWVCNTRVIREGLNRPTVKSRTSSSVVVIRCYLIDIITQADVINVSTSNVINTNLVLNVTTWHVLCRTSQLVAVDVVVGKDCFLILNLANRLSNLMRNLIAIND